MSGTPKHEPRFDAAFTRFDGAEENLSIGLICPPQGHILKASLHVAERIATSICCRE